MVGSESGFVAKTSSGAGSFAPECHQPPSYSVPVPPQWVGQRGSETIQHCASLPGKGPFNRDVSPGAGDITEVHGGCLVSGQAGNWKAVFLDSLPGSSTDSMRPWTCHFENALCLELGTKPQITHWSVPPGGHHMNPLCRRVSRWP